MSLLYSEFILNFTKVGTYHLGRIHLYPFQNILQKLPIILRGSVALDKVEKIGLSLASQKEDTSIWEQRDKEIQNSKSSTSSIHPSISSRPLLSVEPNWTALELEQVIRQLHTFSISKQSLES